MLKRQDSSLSSSSRRQASATATPPPPHSHHAKPIGCMSGIIHLFSKYHHSNKRITFGRKQEKRKPSKPIPQKQTSTSRDDAKVVPRSPTLPPEIRRTNTPEIPSPVVAEKRERLLRALEKCNDDLEALKRVIKAVQAANVRLQLQPPRVQCSTCTDEVDKAAEELTTTTTTRVHVTPQRKPATASKKPGEDDESIAKLISINRTTTTDSSLYMRRRQAAVAALSPPWCSRAMVQSVEEVCGDITWGEKREIGRIGLVLQDHLCRELIDDLIKDMRPCTIPRPLPLEACKRRLCF